MSVAVWRHPYQYMKSGSAQRGRTTGKGHILQMGKPNYSFEKRMRDLAKKKKKEEKRKKKEEAKKAAATSEPAAASEPAAIQPPPEA